MTNEQLNELNEVRFKVLEAMLDKVEIQLAFLIEIARPSDGN